MSKSEMKDYLVLWRERRRLTQKEVEVALNLPEGAIQNFELRGFAKVPGRVLITILCFYRVPLKQVYQALDETKKKINKE